MEETDNERNYEEEQISNGLIILFIIAAMIVCSIGAYQFIESKVVNIKTTTG